MAYSLSLKKVVIKLIEKRTQKEKDSIDEKFRILIENPYPNSSLDIKKLSNSSSYRLRINDYRFIYTIIDNELIVMMSNADSRGDIY